MKNLSKLIFGKTCTFIRRGIMCTVALLTMLAVAPTVADAQGRQTVSGKVSDSNGAPLAGVTVLIPKEGKGAITDASGSYSLSVPGDQELTFSFIGMKSITESIDNRTTIDVVMHDDGLTLDPIVAVGYGTMRRSDLTGSISSISSEDIAKTSVTSIDQVLQGRAAGIQMTQNTGMPGGGSSIRVRGVSSLHSSNEPIIIIDGVTVNASTGTYTDNALSSINPSDIESMDILKDASAVAIYGAQGANGVIIITTKRGKEGAPRINFDASWGFQSIPRRLDMMNLREYAAHTNELYEIRDITLRDEFADPSKLSRGTNWQKEMFNTALIQNYNLSLSGGTPKTAYSVGFGYMDQEGIAYGSGFDRFTLRATIDTDAQDWLTVGASANVSRSTQNITISDDNLIMTALLQTPHVAARNPDGSFGGPSEQDSHFGQLNPLGLAMLKKNENEKANVRSNIYLDIKPIEGLSLRTELSADLGSNNAMQFTPEYDFGAIYNSVISRNVTKNYSRFWSWKNVATFNRTFNDIHTINAMAGHEVNSSKWEYLNGNNTGGHNSLTDLSAGDATTGKTSGSTGKTNFVSAFGRVYYSLMDKYMVTATIRYDGTSRFAKSEQWGWFPSVAFAWRLSEESFMKKIDWLDNLKLRLGYGAVGNSDIPTGVHRANLSPVTTNWGTGYLVANSPNPHLTWEKMISYNIGIDFAVLRNRIDLVVDAYIKKTDDLLMQISLPGYLGSQGQGAVSAPWGNVGAIENKGLEVTLNTVNIEKKDFRWSSNVVFSYNKNKVTDMGHDPSPIDIAFDMSGGKSIVTRTAVGGSVGQFYGYNVIGRINSANDLYDSKGELKVALPKDASVGVNGIWVGDLLYEDVHADGVIDEKDRQYLGSPLPKFTYGIGNTFSYKNFDLNIYLVGSHGNKAFNWVRRYIDNPSAQNNLSRSASNYAKIGMIDPNGSASDIYNVYVQSGNSKMPRISAADANDNNRVSSRFVEDASYLRIQNVTLSYNLPKKWVSKLKLDNIRVYLNMQNLYTFTNYSGLDPEIGMAKEQYSNTGQNALMNGIDMGRYPTPRVITFGINIGF